MITWNAAIHPDNIVFVNSYGSNTVRRKWRVVGSIIRPIGTVEEEKTETAEKAEEAEKAVKVEKTEKAEKIVKEKKPRTTKKADKEEK